MKTFKDCDETVRVVKEAFYANIVSYRVLQQVVEKANEKAEELLRAKTKLINHLGRMRG